MNDSASETYPERRKSANKSADSTAVSKVVLTLRLAKVRLLAYIGGMDFQTEFINLNGSYLRTVGTWQNRLEHRKSELLEFRN